MTHTAIYGMTEHGKSWLMKRRMEELEKLGQRFLTFDGLGDREYLGFGPMFTKAWQFENALRDPANQGCFVVVDEAKLLYAQTRRRKEFVMINQLGSVGRHRGHKCYFATQKPTMLDAETRANCNRAAIFRMSSRASVKLVLEDYGLEDDRALLARIIDLPPCHYFDVTPGRAVFKRLR